MQTLPVQDIHLVWVYLENHNLAIISLQVESPGGGDEALSRADDIVAPTGHGLHHRGGLRAESHGLQLEKRQQDTVLRGKVLSVCVCPSVYVHARILSNDISIQAS